MHYKKIILKIITFMSVILMLSNFANAQNIDDIKAKGEIRIGVMVDIAPFGLINENNQPVGYDIDVAKLFAKHLGVKVTLVPVTGPNRIPYLLSRQVDILVASLGITPERAATVDFSHPYVGIRNIIYGKKDVNVADYEELKSHVVGVTRGSTQETVLAKIMPKDKLRRFDDDTSTVQAMLSGQLDLVAISSVVVSEINKVIAGKYDEKLEVAQQVQGIAIRKNNQEMMKTINDFLDEVKKNGELNAIHEKWLGEPLPSLKIPDFIK